MRATSGQHRHGPRRQQPSGRNGAGAADRRAEQRPPRRHRRRVAGKPPSRAGDVVRGFTGSLAAGLLVLAIGLVAVQLWATANGRFGPGVGVVIGHFVACGAALTAQAVADRRRNALGGVCVLAVPVVVLAALWYWWWL